MITLEVADLVVIASRTLGLDTGQVLELLDTAAARQALAQAQPGSGYGDPATSAAALLHALVRRRPLRRGNQQVALAATLQFLALNGWEMDPGPPELVAAVVADIAAGRLDAPAVAAWLVPRLRPSDRGAAQASAVATAWAVLGSVMASPRQRGFGVRHAWSWPHVQQVDPARDCGNATVIMLAEDRAG